MYISGYGSSVCMLIPQSIVYFVMFMHIGGILSRGIMSRGDYVLDSTVSTLQPLRAPRIITVLCNIRVQYTVVATVESIL